MTDTPHPLTQRFIDAVGCAVTWHATQRRKCSHSPYVEHLLGVCSIALANGANEDEAIAALLHDAVEDQGGLPRLIEIRQRFGPAVADIVEGCTDSLTAADEKKAPWRQRKEAHLARLAAAPPSVLLVSASDKLHNARALVTDYRQLGPAMWKLFKGGRDGVRWYYQSLLAIFEKSGPVRLTGELSRVVRELVDITNSDTGPATG